MLKITAPANFFSRAECLFNFYFLYTFLEYVAIWLGLAKIGVIPALINYNLKKVQFALTNPVKRTDTDQPFYLCVASLFVFGIRFKSGMIPKKRLDYAFVILMYTVSKKSSHPQIFELDHRSKFFQVLSNPKQIFKI